MLNERLAAALAQLPDLQGKARVHVLQCSSRYADGAIVLHVWRGNDRNPKVILKTPRNPRGGASIRSEWENMSGLRANSQLSAVMPAPLATFNVDGADFYAYAASPGRTMFSLYRNRLLMSRERMLQQFCRSALSVAVKLHRSATQLVPSKQFASDLRNDLAGLRDLCPSLPAEVVAKAESAASRLEALDAQLPKGRIHGDFSPFNLITTGSAESGKVTLIDWEHCEPSRPQHLDILRFVSACVLMDRGAKHGAASALADMAKPQNPLIRELLSPWLRAMCPAGGQEWLGPGLLELLWWSFWIHAARREQERATDPRDFSAGTFVRGLMRL